MTIKKRIFQHYNEDKDSMLNVLSELMNEGYEPELIAEVIKEDSKLYNIYRNECLMRNMLKRDNVETLEAIFGEG